MNADKPTLSRPLATVNLEALVANYRRIVGEVDQAEVAAMVKANGYGLGAAETAGALYGAGCRVFFVAGVDEGVRLRASLDQDNAEINILEGPLPGSAPVLKANRLNPVLNSLGQLEQWRQLANTADEPLVASLHIDTGMSRLGFPADEYQRLLAEPTLLDGAVVSRVMSHLVSADIHGDPLSRRQLGQFADVRTSLPMGSASLANSAGIFLGPEYHWDLVRPGISLYGGSPFPDSGKPNPMQTVLTVEAPIIQVRNADPGETVGYGASHRVERPARIATLPVGYADGFLRSASNTGLVAVGDRQVPIVGRVSMDLITIDVTDVDASLLYPGAPVQLIGDQRPIDLVAESAGSIPHELLTNLSGRFETVYC